MVEPELKADRVFDYGQLDIFERDSKEEDWDVEFTQLEVGKFSGQSASWDFPDLCVQSKHLGLKLEVSGKSPPGEVILVIPENGSESIRFEGELVQPGSFVVIEPSQDIHFSVLNPVDFCCIKLGKAIGDRLIHASRQARPARGATYDQIATPRQNEFSALVGLLPKRQSDRSVVLPSPGDDSGRGEFGSTLAESLISAVSNQPAPGGGAPGKGLDRPTLLARRSREFIEANLDCNVSIEDICAATGAKPRSLHYAFIQCYGTTPIAYSRFRRLKRARNLLLRRAVGITVTDAAVSCGFQHLGRFAAGYKAIYGESPSETLGRKGETYG